MPATYSMTSSASPNSLGGTVIWSAFAVERLIDKVILVGNSTGSSPGRRAGQNLVYEISPATVAPAQIYAVADQTAVQHVFAITRSPALIRQFAGRRLKVVQSAARSPRQRARW
jgi:hypothetical protein